MSELQVINKHKKSYRTAQKNEYRLTPGTIHLILTITDLTRFTVDYFNITERTLYRWIKSNDPALTQTGFLTELNEKLLSLGAGQESLIFRTNDNE